MNNLSTSKMMWGQFRKWLNHQRHAHARGIVSARVVKRLSSMGFNWGVTECPKKWRRFTAARKFARGLGLKKQKEWQKYCTSGRKPADIPSSSDCIYRDSGWDSWGDWLGFDENRWRSFAEARSLARGLGLKNLKDWRKYSKSGKKPFDIPCHPERIYGDKGWKSMGDWLGTNGSVHMARRSGGVLEPTAA